MHKAKLYKIGDLSHLSGVPVKTIRHYSDIGILPPTAITQAGFRLYSNADRARLELIRSLREADFGLGTIREVLQNESTVSSALSCKLSAVEKSLRRLRRQRTLLKAALHHGEEGALNYLNHVWVLVNLDAAGRERFLHEYLGRALEGVDGPPDWRAGIWREEVLDLPKEINSSQFEAWLELAELMLDESFLQRLNDMGTSFWSYQKGHDNIESWRVSRDQVLVEALEAAQQGELPQEGRCQALVERYIDVNAAFKSCTGDPTFPRYLLTVMEEVMDPRFQRYWGLIGILKGRSPKTMWCKYQARGWLIEGLKWWVGRAT